MHAEICSLYFGIGAHPGFFVLGLCAWIFGFALSVIEHSSTHTSRCLSGFFSFVRSFVRFDFVIRGVGHETNKGCALLVDFKLPV